MEITLYPGGEKSHREYYTDFLADKNICFKTHTTNLGLCIIIPYSPATARLISEHICRFILEFYFKENVLSKIYDEYPDFDTSDACTVLSQVSKNISDSPISGELETIITQKKSVNPHSFALFYKKPMLRCVYALTDNIAQKVVFSRQRDRFISLVRVFSNLSFENCECAIIEFSPSDMCRVSFDKEPAVEIKNEELIACLAKNSPKTVQLKNPSLNCELSAIVSEIFTNDNK